MLGYLWDDRVQNIWGSKLSELVVGTREDTFFGYHWFYCVSKIVVLYNCCLTSLWYRIPSVGTPSFYLSQHLKRRLSQSISRHWPWQVYSRCRCDCVGCHWFYLAPSPLPCSFGCSVLFPPLFCVFRLFLGTCSRAMFFRCSGHRVTSFYQELHFLGIFLRILPVHLQRQTCKLHLPKHVPESFNNVRYMYGGVSWKMYITSSRFKGFLDFQRGCICSCCDKGKEGLLGTVYPLQTCTPEVF